MVTDFFAYGSLMFADIMAAVSGDCYKSESAVLANYRRFAIRDELYPGIRPQKGDLVTGTVYFDLREAAWERLDRFEGRMYRRETIEVVFADGREAKAQTYVVRSEFTSRLSRKKWSPKEFLRSGKSRFREEYPGFEMLQRKKSDG